MSHANQSDRDVTDVIQLYLHDVAAYVVRPVEQLIGAARVDLAAGENSRVRFRFHADLTSFTGREGRIVEPGPVELWVGSSSENIRSVSEFGARRPPRQVGDDRILETSYTVEPS